MDRFAYIWPILESFAIVVGLITVGLVAWILGII